MLASHCLKCGGFSVPSKPFCPFCGSDSVDKDVQLSSHGRVYSYTVIHQAPGGRATPYVLAYVDLPESVRLLTQVDCEPAMMEVDMPVVLDIRPVEDMAGKLTRLGYVFCPVAGVETGE